MFIFQRMTAFFFIALMAVGSLAAAPAWAQEGSGSGEVRRLDKENRKITLKHGPISELELPAMTLVYLIEPVLMEGLNPGDKVRFKARREDTGEYFIIEIKKR